MAEENTGLRRKYHPRFNKSSLIYLGLMLVGLVVAGAFFYTDREEVKSNSALRATAPVLESEEGGEYEQKNPVLRQAILESNEEKAEEARQSGESVFPRIVPVTAEDESNINDGIEDRYFNAIKETEKRPEKKSVQKANIFKEPAGSSYVDPTTTLEYKRQLEALADVLNSSSSATGISTMMVAAYNQRENVTDVPEVGNFSNSTHVTKAETSDTEFHQTENDAKSAIKRYFNLGDVLYIRLTTVASNKGAGVVTAKVVSGVYQDARLIGSLEGTDEGLVILFNKMSLPNAGITLVINGLAVDVNTARSVIYSKKKTYIFEKILYALGNGFLGGYADSLSKTGETVVTDSLGGSTVVTDEPTKDDALAAGVANAANIVGQMVQTHVNNLSTLYEMDTDTVLSVIMLDDVDYAPTSSQVIKKFVPTVTSSKAFGTMDE